MTGTDEPIKIWDLRHRKEPGGLQQHQGECNVPWLVLRCLRCTEVVEVEFKSNAMTSQIPLSRLSQTCTLLNSQNHDNSAINFALMTITSRNSSVSDETDFFAVASSASS